MALSKDDISKVQEMIVMGSNGLIKGAVDKGSDNNCHGYGDRFQWR